MTAWAELFRYATSSRNVLHVSDGVPFGIAARTLACRARREGWELPRKGVVVAPGFRDCHEQRCWVVLKGIGAPILITGRSALYCAAVIDRPPPFVEAVVPFDRAPRSGHGALLTRSRTFGVGSGAFFGGVPCTGIERALVEGSRRMEELRMLNAYIDAERIGHLTRATAQAVRSALAHVKGVGRLDTVLERTGGVRVDSGMELESRDLFIAWGYHPWPEPFGYRCPDGVEIMLDLAFPFDWICYEIEGRRYHSGPKEFSTDRRRWSEQTKQWSLGWIDRQRLDNDPMGIIADLRDRLVDVDPNRPPPPLPPLSRPDLVVPSPLVSGMRAP